MDRCEGCDRFPRDNENQLDEWRCYSVARDDDDWHEHLDDYSEGELELYVVCPACAVREYA
jgi:hypothetical protein